MKSSDQSTNSIEDWNTAPGFFLLSNQDAKYIKATSDTMILFKMSKGQRNLSSQELMDPGESAFDARV